MITFVCDLCNIAWYIIVTWNKLLSYNQYLVFWPILTVQFGFYRNRSWCTLNRWLCHFILFYTSDTNLRGKKVPISLSLALICSQQVHILFQWQTTWMVRNWHLQRHKPCCPLHVWPNPYWRWRLNDPFLNVVNRVIWTFWIPKEAFRFTSWRKNINLRQWRSRSMLHMKNSKNVCCRKWTSCCCRHDFPQLRYTK